MELNTKKTLTDKLNSLNVKKAMFQSSGYDVPQHINKEIELLKLTLSKQKG